MAEFLTGGDQLSECVLEELSYTSTPELPLVSSALETIALSVASDSSDFFQQDSKDEEFAAWLINALFVSQMRGYFGVDKFVDWLQTRVTELSVKPVILRKLERVVTSRRLGYMIKSPHVLYLEILRDGQSPAIIEISSTLPPVRIIKNLSGTSEN